MLGNVYFAVSPGIARFPIPKLIVSTNQIFHVTMHGASTKPHKLRRNNTHLNLFRRSIQVYVCISKGARCLGRRWVRDRPEISFSPILSIWNLEQQRIFSFILTNLAPCCILSELLLLFAARLVFPEWHSRPLLPSPNGRPQYTDLSILSLL